MNNVKKESVTNTVATQKTLLNPPPKQVQPTPLWKQYSEILQQYKQALHSDQVVVFLQNGSFFEIFDDGSKQTNIQQIASYLDILATKRDKSDPNSIDMCGFPCHKEDRYVETMLKQNWNVIVVEQEETEFKKGFRNRRIKAVHTPGTYLQELNSGGGGVNSFASQRNYLAAIYFEVEDKNKTLSVGVSLFHNISGHTYTFQATSWNHDFLYPIQEIIRICDIYSPSEIVIASLPNLSCKQEILEQLSFQNCFIQNEMETINPNVLKPSFQNTMLQKVYPSCSGLITPIETLGLERHEYALVSFIVLLQSIYQRTETLLQNIHVPQLLQPETKLTLSYHCALNLDVLPSSTVTHGGKTLMNLLNRCKTAVGKRDFFYRLLHPSRDTEFIERSYQQIATFTELPQSERLQVVRSIRDKLDGMTDIEKYFRFVYLHQITFLQLTSLVRSLHQLSDAFVLFQTYVPTELSHSDIVECINKLESYFDFSMGFNNNEGWKSQHFKLPVEHEQATSEDEQPNQTLLAKNNYNSNLVNPINKLRKEIIELFQTINKETKRIEQFALLLKQFDFSLEYLTVECRYTFNLTAARMKKFTTEFNKTPVKFENTVLKYEEFDQKKMASKIRVTHPVLESCNNTLYRTVPKCQAKCNELYALLIQELVVQVQPYTDNIIACCKLTDVTTTNALNAIEYRLCQPTLDKETPAYIDCKQLRHLIVEAVQPEVKYVANDILLRNCDSERSERDSSSERDENNCNTKTNFKQCMLLYGMNAAGKSCLQKSIGHAILLAQAGMYVPCSSMTYGLYDRMFTRIYSGDDIYRGQSTFVKEIQELRVILKMATSQSLVIGDEILVGSESASGLSLMTLIIKRLYERGACFVFATHFHELLRLPQIQEMNRLGVYHLKVEFDQSSNKLIYNRTLTEGTCPPFYGIEVCRGLHLHPNDIMEATNIRNYILKQSSLLVDPSNTSHYNAGLYVDKCMVCKTARATQVHHIQEQHEADQEQYIDIYRKNRLSNLVGICDECHLRHHKGEIDIIGWQTTSNGRELEVLKRKRSPYFALKKEQVKDEVKKEQVKEEENSVENNVENNVESSNVYFSTIPITVVKQETIQAANTACAKALLKKLGTSKLKKEKNV